MNVPIWIVLGFQQRDTQDSQILNNDTFCGIPVVSAQGIIGTEKDPDSVISLNYDDDDYAQGYSQNKEVFKALTKDDIFQPYISDDDFRCFNVGVDDVGHKFFVFGIRYQKKFERAPPVKVEIQFDGVVPNDINGYASVLSNKLGSITNDVSRHFDSL